jgi:FkbM family methyltransferase
MDLQFEKVIHTISGKPVTFVFPETLKDHMVEQWRKEVTNFFGPMPYFDILRNKLGRPLKIVDVGANLGTISLSLAAAGHRVLAIEAELLNFGALVSATAVNRFVNLTPIHIAAYSKPAILGIRGNSLWGQVVEGNSGSSQVFAMPLVDILHAYNFEDSDVVKIDIEGAELACLAGLDPVVKNNSNIEFIYECNTSTSAVFEHESQDLLRRFEEMGFSNYYFLADRLMKASSAEAQPIAVLDVLATRVPEQDIGYLPVFPYSIEFVEKEMVAAAKREWPHHYEHALLQERYLRPEFVASDVWQNSRKLAMEKRAARLDTR